MPPYLHHQPRHQTVASLEVLKQLRAIFSMTRQPLALQRESSCRISGAQLWALAIIARQPGLHMSALARAMAVHQTTASNLVERLSAQKMVEKRRQEGDRRIVCLYLSPAGLECINRLSSPAKGILPEALAKLPPQKLSELQNILTELLGILHTRKSAESIPL
jgi:DNA-binding MarR family transcriptional regulator